METSLLSTAVWMLSSDITYSQAPGYKTHNTEGVRKFPLMDVYATRDGRLIQLMLLDPRPHWRSFCQLIGLEDVVDDPLYADNVARMKNASALTAMIQERIGAKDWAQWQPTFDAWDAPWELIRTIDDVCNDPQVHANEMIFKLPLADTTVNVVAGPASFDGRAAPVVLRGSPEMGEHTDALLIEVGYTFDEVVALKERKIVQ